MDWLTSWFEWFTDVINTIYDFFTSLIENIILLYKYIQIAFNICISFIDSMPTWLNAICFATVSISVLFLIIGRSTGGNKSD